MAKIFGLGADGACPHGMFQSQVHQGWHIAGIASRRARVNQHLMEENIGTSGAQGHPDLAFAANFIESKKNAVTKTSHDESLFCFLFLISSPFFNLIKVQTSLRRLLESLEVKHGPQPQPRQSSHVRNLPGMGGDSESARQGDGRLERHFISLFSLSLSLQLHFLHFHLFLPCHFFIFCMLRIVFLQCNKCIGDSGCEDGGFECMTLAKEVHRELLM